MTAMPYEPDPGAELLPTEEELDAVDLMWLERMAQPWRPTERHPFRPPRCSGIVRNGPRAGRQCPHPSVLGASVCQVHGAQLPVVRQAAKRRVEEARLRLIDAAPDATEWLIDLAENSQSDAVRLKATTEVLDRAGIRGGSELDVKVDASADPASVLRERLERLRNLTVDGEVVQDDEPGDTVTHDASTLALDPSPNEEHHDGER